MAIRFQCLACGKALSVPEAKCGSKGRCSGCQAEVIAPLPARIAIVAKQGSTQGGLLTLQEDCCQICRKREPAPLKFPEFRLEYTVTNKKVNWGNLLTNRTRSVESFSNKETIAHVRPAVCLRCINRWVFFIPMVTACLIGFVAGLAISMLSFLILIQFEKDLPNNDGFVFLAAFLIALPVIIFSAIAIAGSVVWLYRLDKKTENDRWGYAAKYAEQEVPKRFFQGWRGEVNRIKVALDPVYLEFATKYAPREMYELPGNLESREVNLLAIK